MTDVPLWKPLKEFNRKYQWDNKLAKQFTKQLSDDKNYTKEIQQRIEAGLINSSGELIQELFQKTATKMFRCKQDKVYSNPAKPKKLSRSKKWFDKDCTNLKKDIRKLGRQKSKEPTNLVLREKYCVKLKQFKNNCKNKRYHFWQKQFNELEDSLKDSKSFWNKWKQSTDKYPTKPKIDISGENWYNHFHNLHTEKMINLSPTTFTNHHEPCDILNAPFTKDELQHTIDNLKNSKAAGFDGITNEMIKNSPENVVNILLDFTNLCLQKELIPDSYCNDIINPIFKEGIKSDPNN